MPAFSTRNRLRAIATSVLPIGAARALENVASKTRNLAQNANNWDLRRNGESYTIARACTASSPIIFDVGTNEGHWAHEARRLIPEAKIHCFEPVTRTFERACALLADDPQIFLNKSGLGASQGIEDFVVYTDAHELASKYAQDTRYLNGPGAVESITVTTGDAYIADREITQVALLKVDVEGMEFEALSGFRKALQSQMVDVIQFEYGVGYIGARVFLRDVFDLLGSHGYSVLEARPRSWEPISYNFSREDFNPRNFIAVSSSALSRLS